MPDLDGSDRADLAPGSSLRKTCAVDLDLWGAADEQPDGFVLLHLAGPFLHRILKAPRRLKRAAVPRDSWLPACGARTTMPLARVSAR